MNRIIIVISFILLSTANSGSHGRDTGVEEIPQLGRPADIPFSEASGSFRFETDADREIVKVDEPILFVLRIIANGQVHHPPERIDLLELPAFASQFRIEPVDDSARDFRKAAGLIGLQSGLPWANLPSLVPPHEWEFIYRLRPRSQQVRLIPDVPFAFYNPTIRRFQVQYADRIPLEVRPPETVEIQLQVPPWAEHFITGESVRHQWIKLSILSIYWTLLPPLACLAWYISWLILYPDQVRQAKRRKSRAVRLALGILKQKSSNNRKQAQLASAALTQYLHLRHGFPRGELVPEEVAEHLQALQCPSSLQKSTSRFFEDCAAIQYQPTTNSEPQDLPNRATQLILDLEEQL